MPDEKRIQLALDQHEIENLLVRWGHARDSDDWETLAACFHEGATIHISWISGPAIDFVARSRDLAGKRKPGEHTKHLVGGPWVEVAGERAFSRSHATLYIRRVIDGHAYDLQSWLRFFDLLERRDDTWGIVKRTGVYEKDNMVPVNPRGGPEDFFDDLDKVEFGMGNKFLSYTHLKTGRTPASGIVQAFSEDEKALLAEGRNWLGGA